MTVTAIWRYPVKSMAGERVGSTGLSETGLVGDRVVQVYDRHGRIATARRFPQLLRLHATLAWTANRSWTVCHRISVRSRQDGRKAYRSAIPLGNEDIAIGDLFDRQGHGIRVCQERLAIRRVRERRSPLQALEAPTFSAPRRPDDDAEHSVGHAVLTARAR